MSKMSVRKIYWSKQETPVELHSMLSALADEYPVIAGTWKTGIQVKFIKSKNPDCSAVSRKSDMATIEYGTVSLAARAVGTLLAGLESKDSAVFKSLGIMLDCSRNAVMTVSHFKKWLRQLALMGYNQAMLYTEDTYKLPDEPYFGYMRGAYTEDELKEIDVYAASLGIEMIACIQTLGHLEQIIRWAPYSDTVRDTDRVLLVDGDATYKLIDKMIAMWGRVFGSRRIHIGMDETHDLGRGKFMDRFGYERGFEMFNRHLDKVAEICKKYKMKPMIWSDMYFRMGNVRMDYYGKDTVIPEEVKAKIPKSVDLVYWDYYHKEKDFYVDWIRRHRDLGHEPLMGSGVWTWSRLWYDEKLSMETVKPCIAACLEEKVQELFFTLWGDDGAYCEYDSVLAGLCKSAELAFGCDSDEIASKKFAAICSGNYKNYVTLGALQYPCGTENIPGHILLWDDPLLGINWNNNTTVNPHWAELAIKNYRKMLAALESPDKDTKCADVTHGKLLAEVLIMKMEFRQTMLKAYVKKDKAALKNICKVMVPAMTKALKKVLKSFRKQWMRRNKSFGFEVIQLRINAQIGRYEEIAVRIRELLDGEISGIAELDEPAPKVHGGGGWSRFFMSGSTLV